MLVNPQKKIAFMPENLYLPKKVLTLQNNHCFSQDSTVESTKGHAPLRLMTGRLADKKYYFCLPCISHVLLHRQVCMLVRVGFLWVEQTSANN